MDKIIESKKEKTKKENIEVKNEREQFRVVISLEANSSLEILLKKVCEGFEAGAVTKSDIANYVFTNLQKFFQEADIKALRTTHFDDKKVLSSILKNEVELPEELKKAIRAHYGITEKEKRKLPKPPSEQADRDEVSLQPVA